MSLPVPRPGLVICYSYLWAEEHRGGHEEGIKNRPCAVVAASQVIDGKNVVTVIPITHSPQNDRTLAIEIPAAIKQHLGLDGLPSWIMVSEANDFLWTGPDLIPVPGIRPARFDYGMLPPRFYAHVRTLLVQANKQRRLSRIERTD